jgi:hypothetical protein
LAANASSSSCHAGPTNGSSFSNDGDLSGGSPIIPRDYLRTTAAPHSAAPPVLTQQISDDSPPAPTGQHHETATYEQDETKTTDAEDGHAGV